ncbi:hypothetical protein B1R94_27015 [Mycolicibacterium litorale]|nr:hypothetical protein B1R94_27015 [Mycolicibacterium litorale]
MSADGAGSVGRFTRVSRLLLTGWALLIYVFLFVPVILMVVFSFNANRYGTFPVTGWTLDWYRAAIENFQIHSAVANTVEIGVAVAVLASVIGTMAAFPLARSKHRFAIFAQAGLLLPIMIPGLLIGVGLLAFFTQTLHIGLSKETAIIGQTVYTTPFVVLTVAARIQALDPRLEVAAGDLGANRFNTFRFITLPLIGPAIFAGALLAFTLSLDEFVITLFLVGNDNTLPIYIYTQVKYGITPEVNAIATLLLLATVLTGAVMVLVPMALRGSKKFVRNRAA